jgi:hypothetical protein
VLRIIYVPKGKRANWKTKKVHEEEHCDLYSLSYVSDHTKVEMGGEDAFNILIWSGRRI